MKWGKKKINSRTTGESYTLQSFPSPPPAPAAMSQQGGVEPQTSIRELLKKIVKEKKKAMGPGGWMFLD